MSELLMGSNLRGRKDKISYMTQGSFFLLFFQPFQFFIFVILGRYNTQQCSWLSLDSILRDHTWQTQGTRQGCQGFNTYFTISLAHIFFSNFLFIYLAFTQEREAISTINTANKTLLLNTKGSSFSFQFKWKFVDLLIQYLIYFCSNRCSIIRCLLNSDESALYENKGQYVILNSFPCRPHKGSLHSRMY